MYSYVSSRCLIMYGYVSLCTIMVSLGFYVKTLFFRLINNVLVPDPGSVEMSRISRHHWAVLGALCWRGAGCGPRPRSNPVEGRNRSRPPPCLRRVDNTRTWRKAWVFIGIKGSSGSGLVSHEDVLVSGNPDWNLLRPCLWLWRLYHQSDLPDFCIKIFKNAPGESRKTFYDFIIMVSLNMSYSSFSSAHLHQYSSLESSMKKSGGFQSWTSDVSGPLAFWLLFSGPKWSWFFGQLTLCATK